MGLVKNTQYTEPAPCRKTPQGGLTQAKKKKEREREKNKKKKGKKNNRNRKGFYKQKVFLL